MKRSLKGKIAVVTGVGSGIGRAIAIRLAEDEASYIPGRPSVPTADATWPRLKADLALICGRQRKSLAH